jgi:hypothetical protein
LEFKKEVTFNILPDLSEEIKLKEVDLPSLKKMGEISRLIFITVFKRNLNNAKLDFKW